MEKIKKIIKKIITKEKETVIKKNNLFIFDNFKLPEVPVCASENGSFKFLFLILSLARKFYLPESTW